jgi:hypothetical protein
MYQLLSNVLIHKLYISRKLLHLLLCMWWCGWTRSKEDERLTVIYRVMISLDSNAASTCCAWIYFWYLPFVNERYRILGWNFFLLRQTKHLSHNICSFSQIYAKAPSQFPWWFYFIFVRNSFEYEMCLPENFTVTERNFASDEISFPFHLRFGPR